MRQRQSISYRIFAMAVGFVCLASSTGRIEAATLGEEVFQGLTTHISRQIDKDKVEFVVAQNCTLWFYRQQRAIAAPPTIEKISLRRIAHPLENLDCPHQYPQGLESAREDFGRTQQSLSLSLTFFQVALVGDRDDNGQYSPVELRDLLESFGLAFEARLPSARYLLALTETFDSVREARAMPALMKSMNALFDRGYRFTDADQQALNRELH